MSNGAAASRLAASQEPQHLDLRMLSQYLLVCETLNMSAAARRMGLSTSAVSQVIQRLEHDLRVALFERTPQGLRMTPAGVVLRERTQALLASETDTLVDLSAYRGQLLPTLRIYILDNIGICLMNAIVTELSPVVRKLEILSGRTLTHVRDFISGDIDILVSSEDFPDIPKLARHRLCRQNFLAVVPAELPVERRQPLVLAGTLPLVRFREHSRMDEFVQAYLDARGLDLPRTIECDSPGTMLELVAAGLAWTIVTPFAVSWFRHRQKRLAWLPLPEPIVSHDLFLVASSERLLDLPAVIANRCRAALRDEMRSWQGTSAEPGLAAAKVYPDD
jgi:DNA-binding transcriptional LysR family regulator